MRPERSYFCDWVPCFGDLGMVMGAWSVSLIGAISSGMGYTELSPISFL